MSDHMNQINDYPKGTRVQTTAEVFCHSGVIPVGTKGTVTNHCDDGRAWIFFDGYGAGHTFHEPERCVRVINQSSDTTELHCHACNRAANSECVEQGHRMSSSRDELPALRAGEREHWRLKKYVNEIDADLLVNDSYIGIVYIGRAEQIVSVMNQHATLVEQRGRLVQLLRQFVSPTHCYCLVLAKSKKCGQCEARELLATIEQEGEAS